MTPNQNKILEWIHRFAHLVNDSSVSYEEMEVEVDSIKNNLDGFTSEEKDTMLNIMQNSLFHKLTMTQPAEVLVPNAVITKRCRESDIPDDIIAKIKHYALTGYKLGLKEKEKPKEERASVDGFQNMLLNRLNDFSVLPEQYQRIAFHAVVDGFAIAVEEKDLPDAVSLYVFTNGFDPFMVRKYKDISDEIDKLMGLKKK